MVDVRTNKVSEEEAIYYHYIKSCPINQGNVCNLLNSVSTICTLDACMHAGKKERQCRFSAAISSNLHGRPSNAGGSPGLFKFISLLASKPHSTA